MNVAKHYIVGNLGDISVALVGGGLAHSCCGGGSADDEQTGFFERRLQFLRQGLVHLPCYHHYHRLLTFPQEVEDVLFSLCLEAAHHHLAAVAHLGSPVVAPQHSATAHLSGAEEGGLVRLEDGLVSEIFCRHLFIILNFARMRAKSSCFAMLLSSILLHYIFLFLPRVELVAHAVLDVVVDDEVELLVSDLDRFIHSSKFLI